MDRPAVFLDTSIHIARRVHSPVAQAKIKSRLDLFGTLRTGLVTRKEFKHALLAEARFLLGKLDDLGSFDEHRHYLNRYPTLYPSQNRKKNICLDMISRVYAENDRERTEVLRNQLWLLLRTGLRSFDASVDEREDASGCGCALIDVRIRPKRSGKTDVDMGPKECSALPQGQCRIADFLAVRRDQCELLLRHLEGLPAEEVTNELRAGAEFLRAYLADPEAAVSSNPCLTVGDMLIALESMRTDNFFTMNHRESRHLCRPLGQTLIVRPIRPEADDVICTQEETDWNKFS